MKLKCIFNSNINQVYNITTGSVFKDNFNETLESYVLRLDNIADSERLIGLKPYDYVYVYSEDKSFSQYYFVDNFVENMLNISEKLWSYTINLMSETKILEKFQCPNIKIDNSLVSTKYTIGEYIRRFCFLYIKKVKYTENGTDWFYKPFIDYEEVVNDPKFNVPCPDIAVNSPTLKELLTQLMQVVGCLPRVRNHKLTYIDLRAKPTLFTANKVNYITRSMASDSYVNSLVVQGENIIDTNNFVVNETIGFRDRDKVFLKQTENLKLNTKQKIYSVKKLFLNVYLSDFYMFLRNNGASGSASIDNGFSMWGAELESTGNFKIHIEVINTAINKTFNNVVIKLINYGSQASSGISTGGTLVKTISLGDCVATLPFGTSGTSDFTSFEYESESSGFTDVIVECDYNSHHYFFSQFIAGNTGYTINNNMYDKTLQQQFYGIYKRDISALCYEESKRQLLDTDFLKMSAVSTISALSQYYYGTVGYSIGGNEISGFSQTYSVSNGFWDTTKTYIENILNVLLANDKMGDINYEKLIAEKFFMPVDRVHVEIASGIIYNPSGTSQFANIFFDLAYVPMNSLSIKYAKEINDIPLEIEQLDTQEASIPSFDTMSNREIEKANRLGNNLYQLHASFLNNFEINDLNTYYDFTYGDTTDRAIVFSREISVYEDFIDVNYVATKDYVLKEYFTSIQTKYRAYEYIAYDKAVERKENVKVYALIDKYFINGDDRLWLGKLNKSNANNEKSLFLSGAIRKIDTTDNLIRYTYESDTSLLTRFKNEVSLPNFKNAMCFSFRDFDNISAGNYIKNITYNEALGGLPQGWYIWSDASMFSRVIGFFSTPHLVSDYPVYLTESDANNNLEKIYNDPKINTSFDPNENSYNNIYVVDNNVPSYSERILSPNLTIYKNNGEIYNLTLQIEYYTTSEDIAWTSHFISLNELSDYEQGNKYNEVEITNSLSLTENLQTDTIESIVNVNDYLELNTDNKDIPYLRVKWGTIPSTINYFKIINRPNGGTSYYDVIAFYRNGSTSDTNYYISFNDTKTEKIYAKDEISDLWALEYYVDKNTLSRTCSISVSNGFYKNLVGFTVSEESIVDFSKDLVYFFSEVENV